MKKRKIVRRGDVLLNIPFEDGHSSPFLKVKRIDWRGVTIGPRWSNPAMNAFVMTTYESDLLNATRAYSRFGNSWKVSATLKFGETRRFVFKERKWSLVIRADRRKRRGTALITATVDRLD